MLTLKHFKFSLALLAAPALLLSACSANLTLTPTAQADIQTALNAACPVLAAVQSAAVKPNARQVAAMNTLALACPPNPAPTNAVVAATDLLAAAQILAPLAK